MLSNLIVMHSRPWLWVTSRAEAATPALVATGPVTGQPDTVGAIFGVPVMVDDNIPTNLGTGTDEDRILTLRTGDHLLFEDRPRVMIDENRAAGSGGVKLVAFRYVAFTAAWYPGGVGILAGSGLNAVAS